MKRLVSALLTLVMLVSFAGCNAPKEDDGKINVVATIFPCYDWAREVIGDSGNVSLELLIDNGVDLHSFQPTAEDIMKIKTCDVFIYVGGESDAWVSDAISSDANPDMKIINLMDELKDSVREEELVEGMEAEEEEDEESEEEAEYDEHVWMSLRNAEVITEKICEVLSEADPENAGLYSANCEKYVSELKDLDSRYIEAVSSADLDTIVVADRYPFRYMSEDYGLDYYAAFIGCSAETQASFETVVFLADKAKETGTKVILTTESPSGDIASTVIETGGLEGVTVEALDSMQSVTASEVSSGISYLKIMEDNLTVLEKALTT